MTFPEMMFYAEEEGLLPSHRGKLNAVIKEVEEYPGVQIPQDAYEAILNKYGLSFSTLTIDDIKYINRHFQKS